MPTPYLQLELASAEGTPEDPYLAIGKLSGARHLGCYGTVS
jgi:hypothetical protein